MTTMTDLFGPIISAYSRADAIAEGTLIDVTETAREAGISLPVAVTAEVWADMVTWTDADEDRKPCGTGQDEAGRLWDLIWMLRCTMMRRAGQDHAAFETLRVPREGRGLRPRKVVNVAHIGYGDHGEPVLTIMQPGQS